MYTCMIRNITIGFLGERSNVQFLTKSHQGSCNIVNMNIVNIILNLYLSHYELYPGDYFC